MMIMVDSDNKMYQLNIDIHSHLPYLEEYGVGAFIYLIFTINSVLDQSTGVSHDYMPPARPTKAINEVVDNAESIPTVHDDDDDVGA